MRHPEIEPVTTNGVKVDETKWSIYEVSIGKFFQKMTRNSGL